MLCLFWDQGPQSHTKYGLRLLPCQRGIGAITNKNATKLSCCFEVTFFLIQYLLDCCKPLFFKVIRQLVFIVSAYFLIFLWGNESLELPVLPFFSKLYHEAPLKRNCLLITPTEDILSRVRWLHLFDHSFWDHEMCTWSIYSMAWKSFVSASDYLSWESELRKWGI